MVARLWPLWRRSSRRSPTSRAVHRWQRPLQSLLLISRRCCEEASSQQWQRPGLLVHDAGREAFPRTIRPARRDPRGGGVYRASGASDIKFRYFQACEPIGPNRSALTSFQTSFRHGIPKPVFRITNRFADQFVCSENLRIFVRIKQILHHIGRASCRLP